MIAFFCRVKNLTNRPGRTIAMRVMEYLPEMILATHIAIWGDLGGIKILVFCLIFHVAFMFFCGRRS